jgi:hypothetical protein
MAQPDLLLYDTKRIIARWRSFERWSQPLTGPQFYTPGINGYPINSAGGLQGDPVLTLPSIPADYNYISLLIRSKCATQQSNGADAYPLSLSNYGCGYSAPNGIKIDGIISTFMYSGDYGELQLLKLPQMIDFSSLFLQYLIDSSYNAVAFPLAGPGSKFIAMKFDISLHGYN